ncbi:4Fe-4S dicluster domain-containing protein [Geomobilimonas luticola]|uniref:4Fe-4S dicluster domain-containing protein n=1 Tax=Geomobilimonas luticola TaxID=1114878 RepID=A0ABS5SDC1_9BACT|nr:4Fe-4S dicluster domain-containing protein [Geomobilimonas luticola]MBT0653366.1 4Fe-4S dicluster domain-containing protein [Geomobilimonas luticola]
MIDRRDFCKKALLIAGGMAIPLSALELFDPKRLLAEKNDPAPTRWVFLVDTHKCVGCGFCVKACKIENEIPYDANVTRTWVERYVISRDGKTHIDSPKGARDGFISPKMEQGVEHPVEVRNEDIAKAFFVPKLCNQCDNPPCVQVCPVGATYQTADGVVLVDRSWCIGCGYCIMGCPYGVRFFHPVYHVAEKCNFCYHRITKGMKTACVDACPFGARRIGNLKDPNDPVTRVIMTERVNVLKEEYGTKPQVFYLGLTKEVK